jgi:hypothetical protein
VPDALATALLQAVVGAARSRLASALAEPAGRLDALRDGLAREPTAAEQAQALPLLDAVAGGLPGVGDAQALARSLNAIAAVADELAGGAAGPTPSADGAAFLGRFLAARFGAPLTSGALHALGGDATPEFSVDTAGVTMKVVAAERHPFPLGAELGSPQTLTATLAWAEGALGLRFTANGCTLGLAGEALQLLGATPDLRFDLDLAAGDGGLAVEGRGPHANVQAYPSASPVRASTIDLGVGAAGDRLRLEARATLVGSLVGVGDAVVQGIGAAVELDPLEGGVPAAVTPLAPTGLGIELRLGPAHGGGYLAQSGSEFSGALDLWLGFVEVSAVGILDTDHGLSLIAVMGVRFPVPIEIFLGLTLNAVGGILGIRHGVDDSALQAGIGNGALDRILLPDNPVAQAPAIISTLRAVFPPQDGAFLVGPAVEVGWGRPVSFLSLDLAILLLIPDPAIRLLGRGRVTLPAPELPIVDLRAAIYGDLSAERISLRGSLAGSRLAGFPLAGDMALLVQRGDDAELAVTAGGFHPQYRPPRGLEGLQRLSLDLGPPAGLRMRSESYFALTSNSVQLGAQVQIAAVAGPVEAEGHLGFDALIRWEPRFLFVLDVGVGVSIRFEDATIAGIDVALHLEGPGPWRAHGTGSFTFLLIHHDFDVGPFEWGDEDNPPEPVEHPSWRVAAQLADAASWRSHTLDGAESLVRLADTASADTILVHPLAAFELRETVAPLDTRLDRFGAAAIAPGEQVLSLVDPKLGPIPDPACSVVTERFSAGEFMNLTDEQRLSQPGFEELPAGLRLASAAPTFGPVAPTEVRYRTIVRNADCGAPGDDPDSWDRAAPSRFVAGIVARTGAAGRSSLRSAVPVVDPAPLRLADAAHVEIRSADDLTKLFGDPGETLTVSVARTLLDRGALATARAPQLVALGASEATS